MWGFYKLADFITDVRVHHLAGGCQGYIGPLTAHLPQVCTSLELGALAKSWPSPAPSGTSSITTFLLYGCTTVVYGNLHGPCVQGSV